MGVAELSIFTLPRQARTTLFFNRVRFVVSQCESRHGRVSGPQQTIWYLGRRASGCRNLRTSLLSAIADCQGQMRRYIHQWRFSRFGSVYSLSCNRRFTGKKMGIAGREYLQAHFTPEKIARQYADVLFQDRSKRWESQHFAQVSRLEKDVALRQPAEEVRK